MSLAVIPLSVGSGDGLGGGGGDVALLIAGHGGGDDAEGAVWVVADFGAGVVVVGLRAAVVRIIAGAGKNNLVVRRRDGRFGTIRGRCRSGG